MLVCSGTFLRIYHIPEHFYVRRLLCLFFGVPEWQEVWRLRRENLQIELHFARAPGLQMVLTD